MEEVDKGCPMIRMGVFLLVPAYPGSPGPKTVKWLCVVRWSIYALLETKTHL